MRWRMSIKVPVPNFSQTFEHVVRPMKEVWKRLLTTQKSIFTDTVNQINESCRIEFEDYDMYSPQEFFSHTSVETIPK